MRSLRSRRPWLCCARSPNGRTPWLRPRRLCSTASPPGRHCRRASGAPSARGSATQDHDDGDIKHGDFSGWSAGLRPSTARERSRSADTSRCTGWNVVTDARTAALRPRHQQSRHRRMACHVRRRAARSEPVDRFKKRRLRIRHRGRPASSPRSMPPTRRRLPRPTRRDDIRAHDGAELRQQSAQIGSAYALAGASRRASRGARRIDRRRPPHQAPFRHQRPAGRPFPRGDRGAVARGRQRRRDALSAM